MNDEKLSVLDTKEFYQNQWVVSFRYGTRADFTNWKTISVLCSGDEYRILQKLTLISKTTSAPDSQQTLRDIRELKPFLYRMEDNVESIIREKISENFDDWILEDDNVIEYKLQDINWSAFVICFFAYSL